MRPVRENGRDSEARRNTQLTTHRQRKLTARTQRNSCSRQRADQGRSQRAEFCCQPDLLLDSTSLNWGASTLSMTYGRSIPCCQTGHRTKRAVGEERHGQHSALDCRDLDGHVIRSRRRLGVTLLCAQRAGACETFGIATGTGTRDVRRVAHAGFLARRLKPILVKRRKLAAVHRE